MHVHSVTGHSGARADPTPAEQARRGTASWLAQALRDTRADTLRLFDAYAAALPTLVVPQHPTLNPPRWELGHIGWFQTRWLERHLHWQMGPRADPTQPLRPARAAQADALFDSSTVPHATRWGLPLPSIDALREELARGLEATLAMLEDITGAKATAEERAPADDPLYFFRLVLLHEDMHHEAGLYMAQALGVPVDDARWLARALPTPPPALAVPAGGWSSTPPGAPGFHFDNELGAQTVEVPAFEIDAQAVRWSEYLPFVESGGYADPRWWTPEGWRWLQDELPRWREIAKGGAPKAEPVGPVTPPTAPAARSPRPERAEASAPVCAAATSGAAPRYLRRRPAEVPTGPTGLSGSSEAVWECWRQGRWSALDLRKAASHLSAHEARAWCAWAGRRLPTEFEWERALATHPQAFRWGDVWEWTASPHQAFPGFVAHPYRDYSAPWFDGRPVLKGASHLTQPRMRHPRYRNFFTPDRNDLAAGFRSCAPSGA